MEALGEAIRRQRAVRKTTKASKRYDLPDETARADAGNGNQLIGILVAEVGFCMLWVAVVWLTGCFG